MHREQPIKKMPQVLSKSILAVEAVPIVYGSLVCVFYFASLFSGDFRGCGFQEILLRVLCATSLVAVLAGWRLMLCFWAFGAAGLQHLSAVWWTIACVGAGIGILSLVACQIPSVFDLKWASRIVGGMTFFRLGTYFVVPLTHLALEYRRRVIPAGSAHFNG